MVKKISIQLEDDEYIESKKTGLSHREIYLKGLGLEYKPKKIGRPSFKEIIKIIGDE